LQIGQLIDNAKAQYKRWLALLHEGFTVVTHGFGSKRALLHGFRREMLKERDCVVINGYFPMLMVRHVLDAIEQEALGPEQQDFAMMDIQDQMERLVRLLYADNGWNQDRLYLIVHSVDGQALRGDCAQNVVARLAALPRVHLVCSVDHINAPLLWDGRRLAALNPVWFDTTTFLPYAEETRHDANASLPLVARTAADGGSLAISSLTSVFASLNENAREIFLHLARRQAEAEEAGDEDFPGVAFPELYRRCRDAFLVNSDLTLRAQLTEFLDHRLVTSRKGADGVEYLTVPLPAATLREFEELQGCKD